MEFLVKGIIELQGDEYDLTHNFLPNLAILEGKHPKIQAALDSIEKNAAMFLSWETKSRYLDDFYVVESKLVLALDICKRLIAYVDSMVASL